MLNFGREFVWKKLDRGDGWWIWMPSSNTHLTNHHAKYRLHPGSLTAGTWVYTPFEKEIHLPSPIIFRFQLLILGGCKLNNKNLGPFLEGRSMPKLITPKNNIKKGPFPLLQYLYLATWVNRNINLQKHTLKSQIWINMAQCFTITIFKNIFETTSYGVWMCLAFFGRGFERRFHWNKN